MLVDRKKGTLEKRRVVRGDTSTTFQVRIILFLSFSGGLNDLFTTTNIHHNTEAEVVSPPTIKHINLIFPFCEIKNNICLQLCYMVVQNIQVCGKANNHIREQALLLLEARSNISNADLHHTSTHTKIYKGKHSYISS